MIWLQIYQFFHQQQEYLWVNSGIHNSIDNAIQFGNYVTNDTHQEILRNIYFFIPKAEIVAFFTLFMLFMLLRIVLAILKFIKD